MRTGRKTCTDYINKSFREQIIYKEEWLPRSIPTSLLTAAGSKSCIGDRGTNGRTEAEHDGIPHSRKKVSSAHFNPSTLLFLLKRLGHPVYLREGE
ncbi:dubious [Schizosaccharomyces pombe]|uniref:Uncharacterized protein C3D6.16 n=1 Tax=Schizosaccharomyces pombe (strain 972 / ATCC 24843) TaxID=284812 RepID=YB1G_SCHPO|nr:uncharacterized protein SPBC3D6.16 [Schizosaccharomyces pombe]Q4ZGE2.1 RecName: Full=Uncharacterized protein C3D6.16 [Schizosaccharomyces pombe 972h-]CAI94400.1 dubious [Schizosaccharomyces pombe]|eukprot:NP_001343013.1 uncharacterized protein SPBC3D6.16 [Schizosaccharomyces pombe]